MDRPALRGQVRTTSGSNVDLVACHLKSKLLTFPGGRFSTRDEGERARFGAYALFRRAAEAVTVRAQATVLLDGQGQDKAVVVLGDFNDEPRSGHHPGPSRTSRLRDWHRRLRPTRPERCPAALESGRPDPGSE